MNQINTILKRLTFIRVIFFATHVYLPRYKTTGKRWAYVVNTTVLKLWFM